MLFRKIRGGVLWSCLCIALSACSVSPSSPETDTVTDSAPASTPFDLSTVPDAVPQNEPISRSASRPYSIMGVQYVPMTELRPYRARGIASWYGQKFHGSKTALGETYDMYAMTAAHPTLPLPSFVRVTRIVNGEKSAKSVIVRVNDRGPFLYQRVIDLSYAAAYKLGFSEQGTAEVEIETVFPEGAKYSPSDKLAPASTTVVQTPQDAPVQAAGKSGYIVQLGVFQNRANAESFFSYVKQSLDGNRFKARLEMRADKKFRVYVGAYKTLKEAQNAARALSESLGLETFLTKG